MRTGKLRRAPIEGPCLQACLKGSHCASRCPRTGENKLLVKHEDSDGFRVVAPVPLGRPGGLWVHNRRRPCQIWLNGCS